METILMVIHTLAAVALVGIILVQRSDQDGFGMGSSSGGGMGIISGRSKANFMTRTTAILAAVFMLSSLGSVYISTGGGSSVVDKLQQESPAGITTPTESAPEETPAPTVPLGQ